MANNLTEDNAQQVFLNNYKTMCKCSWFTPSVCTSMGIEYFNVSEFRYTLTQYTPSIYAEIDFVITSDDYANFIKYKDIYIASRKVEVIFDDRLVDLSNEKNTYFAGPYKFVCFECNCYLIGYGYQVTLYCVDEMFYKLKTSGVRSTSKDKITATDYIKKIIEEDNKFTGSCKVMESSKTTHRWNQSQLTDYQMIRSLLKYCVSNDNRGNYCFFTMNNQYYLAPPGTTKINNNQVSLPVNNILSLTDEGSVSGIYQALIEQYGSLEKSYINTHGYSSSDNYTSKKLTKVAQSTKNKQGKQYGGVATNYMTVSEETQELAENIKQCYNDLINMFRKVIVVTAFAIPDITPLNCIILTNTDSKTEKSINYDGVYYVYGIQYRYPSTSINGKATMKMMLCSEVDVDGGTIEVQGSPVTADSTNVRSTTGTEATTDIKQDTLLTEEEQEKWNKLVESYGLNDDTDRDYNRLDQESEWESLVTLVEREDR